MVKVVSLKVSLEEQERWRDAAGKLSFNRWARLMLNEAAELVFVERRETERVRAERERLKAAIRGDE